MKKVLALALAAAMALSMVACGSSEPAAPEVTYKTGLGTAISVSATNEDAANEKGASAQVNTTIVAATFDSKTQSFLLTSTLHSRKLPSTSKANLQAQLTSEQKSKNRATTAWLALPQSAKNTSNRSMLLKHG